MAGLEDCGVHGGINKGGREAAHDEAGQIGDEVIDADESVFPPSNRCPLKAWSLAQDFPRLVNPEFAPALARLLWGPRSVPDCKPFGWLQAAAQISAAVQGGDTTLLPPEYYPRV